MVARRLDVMRWFGGHWATRGSLLLPLLALIVLPGAASAQSDTPLLRWEHFYRQRAFPFGRVPRGALQAARREAVARWPRLAAAPAAAAATWQPIGPERIPSKIQSTGRLVAIAIHPANSSIIYVGGAQGGVWKSVDGGANWTPLTDKECSLAMGSIAIDPIDPNIVYAGTGEQHFSQDSYYGCGVLRSTDGGATWTQLGASVFDAAAGGATISRIVVNPSTAGSATSTTVFAASSYGLYRSTNSGTTWVQVLSGKTTDLVMDPTNYDVLYTGGNGMWKSTDGGTTWTQLTTGLPAGPIYRLNLAIAPSAPQTLYAAAVDGTNIRNLLGFYRSTDGGASWTQATAANMTCGQCWYDMTVAVQPTDPNTVYFGGVHVFKSTDGGENFTNATGPIHVDQHLFAFGPQDPSILFVGNDGGIYKSADGGTSWTTLNTNLALTQFYSGMSLHPTDPKVALGGTQDNGTLQYAGSFDWLRVVGGDGGYTAIDFLSPTTRYGETQWSRGSSFSGPRRSDAGGPYVRKVNGIDVSDRALFIPPLVMDPSSPETLYFGSYRLYQTKDRGENWTVISSDLTGGSSAISAIGVAPSNSQAIYVGTGNGNVWVSTDEGGAWTLATTGLPTRYITNFAIHPSDWQTAYVTLSGFFTGHVFKTTDGGSSWQDVSAGLPDMPFNAILLEPGTPSTVYVGTDLGVFRSTDGGSTWSSFNDGLPLVAVLDLAAMANTGVLVAATHGRSMFQAAITVALSLAVNPPTRSNTLVEGSTAPPDSALVRLTGTGSSAVAWTASHGGGTWLTLTAASGMGTGRVRWTRDPNGLAPGTHVDTITITAAGASGSPATVIDTLVLEPANLMSVQPASRFISVIEGNTTPLPDSADVTLTGPDAATRTWTATHGSGTWLTFTTASGTGSGQVRWTRDPSGLVAGTYVDTVTVSSAGVGGSPAEITDTMLVEAPLAMTLDVVSQVDTTVAGTATPLPDSALITVTGAGSGTAGWTAAQGGGSWLTLTATSGTGSGLLRWSKDASNLAAGTYVDTITVTVTGAVGSPAVVVDTLVVAAPITLADAANHLLIGAVLNPLQVAVLDSRGNADGEFNLGDVLAWLDHCTSPTPDGCQSGTSEAQQAGRILERLKRTVPRDAPSGAESREGRRR